MKRGVGYLWASPVTVIGLLITFLAVISGGAMHCRNGVLETSGGCLRWLLRRGAAMALGHVILARDAECLTHSREHELFHVRQYERWGPLLIPVYWGISLWLRFRGFDPYLDHPFEPPPS